MPKRYIILHFPRFEASTWRDLIFIVEHFNVIQLLFAVVSVLTIALAQLGSSLPLV